MTKQKSQDDAHHKPCGSGIQFKREIGMQACSTISPENQELSILQTICFFSWLFRAFEQAMDRQELHPTAVRAQLGGQKLQLDASSDLPGSLECLICCADLKSLPGGGSAEITSKRRRFKTTKSTVFTFIPRVTVVQPRPLLQNHARTCWKSASWQDVFMSHPTS